MFNNVSFFKRNTKRTFGVIVSRDRALDIIDILGIEVGNLEVMVGEKAKNDIVTEGNAVQENDVVIKFEDMSENEKHYDDLIPYTAKSICTRTNTTTYFVR